SGTQAGSYSELGAIGADGRYTVFASDAGAFGVLDEVTQVFLKDAVTGELELISVNSAAQQANQLAAVPGVSDDGRYVVFETRATNLVPPVDPGPDPWSADLRLSYVADRQEGRLALLTIGANDELPDDDYLTWHVISGDGRYVFYSSSATNLLPGPIKRDRHIYRVENPLWEP